MTRGVALLALCVALTGCSFDSSVGSPTDPSDPIDPLNPSDPGAPDAGQPDPTKLQMFTGSETELWRLDRATLATTFVGAFSGAGTFGCGGIALGSDGTLYAVSVGPPSTLYVVDPLTAALTKAFDLTNTDAVWGTTMVPAGTPAVISTENDQLMLGGAGGELYAVDVATGETKDIGNFGGSWGVSGDLAWVDGVGLMGTVDDSGNDQLAVISLSDASLSFRGDTGRGDVYGLTSVDGQLWGLTGDQMIYEMNPDNAAELSSVQGQRLWSIAAP